MVNMAQKTLAESYFDQLIEEKRKIFELERTVEDLNGRLASNEHHSIEPDTAALRTERDTLAALCTEREQQLAALRIQFDGAIAICNRQAEQIATLTTQYQGAEARAAELQYILEGGQAPQRGAQAKTEANIPPS